MPDSDLELVKGTLDLILLKALAWGPMHGLGVVRWIETTTNEQLVVEEGALYPALHRLEQKQLLSAEWGLTEQNRRAKYYRVTARGRTHLAAEQTRWSRYTAAVALILAADGAK
jgi:PadR family transcriptional regulator PadR